MAKKINTQDLIDQDDNDEVRPPLDLSKPLDVQANARTFGAPDLPDAARQVAKPIPLNQITPDPAQPRQAVPLSIRNAAKRDNLPEWQVWHRVAEELHSKPIPLATLLRGEGEAAESDPLGIPLVDAFMDLVNLAASIYRDGLANAITVIEHGTGYIIDTGERRFRAYTLLNGALSDPKFSKINARIVPRADVWRQAAENGARRPLNAIGMARQLALLIMDLYRGKDGIDISPYGQMVQDGECNRKFYAQVANGNVYRIPRGVSERILQTTGLKSRAQIQQYRALLDLSDELWMQADEEDWAEFKIREMVRPPRDTSTAVDVSTQNGNPFDSSTHQKASPTTPLNATGGPLRWPLEGEGVRYMWHNSDRVQIESASLNANNVMIVRVWHLDTRGKRTYTTLVKMDDLKDTPPTSSPFQRQPAGIDYDALPKPAYAPSPRDAAPLKVVIGQTYQQRTGVRRYEVVGIAGDSVSCYEVNLAGKRLMRAPIPVKIDALAEIEMPPEHEAALANILGDDGDEEQTRPEPVAEIPRHLTEREEEILLARYIGSSFIRDDMARETLLRHKLVSGSASSPWDLAITSRGITYLTRRGWVKTPAQSAAYTPIPTRDAFVNTWAKGLPVLVDHPEYHFEGVIHQSFGGTGRAEVLLAGTKDHRQTVDTRYLRSLTADQPVAEDDWSDTDDDQPAPVTQTPVPLPMWAHPGHIVVAPDPDEGEITGVVERSRWNSTDRTWMVLVHFGTHQGECTVDDLRARTDEPVHGLADWCIIGQTVMDAHTNPMDIEDIVWDNSANNWRLQVRDTEGQLWDGLIDIYGPAFSSVIEEVALAAVVPHPGLHPSNASRVVTETQFELKLFRALANAFEMDAEAALIHRLMVLTPNSIAAFLRDMGEEKAYAEIEAMWRACDAVKQRAQTFDFDTPMNTVYNEAAELMRQMAIKKNGAA